MAGGLPSDPFSVVDRQIVIVGGTAGIGLAVATHLVDAGARVVITGRRASGASVATAIGATFVPMDVVDDASVAEGFGLIEGRIDCLVLNAGIDADSGEIDAIDVAIVKQIFDVNTLGLVRALAHGSRAMEAGGSVVVTSSPAGTVAVPGMAAYSASKAALDMLVRAWALELGPRQIRVNAVLPGIVESEMDSESAPEIELIRRMTANGVYRKASEMAPVYHFLASDASATLTGSLVGAHDGIAAGFSHDVIARLGADLGPDAVDERGETT